ncbi:MAG: ATP/GTP-binding protein, partial [Solirubrobacteraceae bacterium]
GKTGDLSAHADYLWRRTQGVIGSLTQLLTEAAAEAIDTESERITQKLLDSIDIGYAAEVGAGRQQPQRAA